LPVTPDNLFGFMSKSLSVPDWLAPWWAQLAALDGPGREAVLAVLRALRARR
jgi:hypothetical protein